MFYTQCWKCGNRWSLGTGSTCTCPDETTKSEWVGLTDEEIKIIWRDIDDSDGMLMRFARAIEAKLRSKNHG